MADFDPDAFLSSTPDAPAAQSVASPEPESPPQPAQTIVMPAAVQPAQEAFDPDKFLAPENEAQYGSPAQQQKTFAEAFARGFGSQPLASAAEVAAGVSRQDILNRQKTNPINNFLGETAGFVAGVFGPGEASLLAKLAPKASLPVKMAIDGFVLSAGDEASKAILQDPDQSAGSAIVHVGLGTAISGALGTVPMLWRATKSIAVDGILNLIKGDSEGVGASLRPDPEVINPSATAQPNTVPGSPADIELTQNPDGTWGHAPKINNFMKAAINVALGPSAESIDARVANLEAIRTAPEFQDVYDHALEHINTVGDDVAAQNKILADAESEFKASGYEAALANQAAKTVLKDAQTQLIQDSSRDAFSKAPAIANAVELLRGQVVDGSQAGYDILANSGKVISLTPLYNVARELQDKVFSQGSPLALQQAEAIGKYIETLGAQYGTQISAENAKSVIKGLDNLSSYKWDASAFDKGLSPVYKGMRQALDSVLKEKVPEYRAAMKPLAEKSSLLSDLSGYGTEEDAVKSINGLKNTPKFINDMPKLRELENRIGIKFTHDLDHYASPALRQMRIAKLPEYEAAEKAAKALAYYKHPESFESLVHSIKSDPEWLAAMEAKNNLKGLTETSLQNKMNAVIGGKNIAARALLQNLPALNGMSIPEILDLIALRQAFAKGAGMGSRNTLLYGGIGTSVGSMIAGLPGASIGSVLGGALGATVDRKGPAIAARLLDKYVDSFGPLAEKAGLSEKATRRALQFILGSETHSSAEGLKAAAEYSESVSKGMSITKKAAKAIFKKGVSVLPQEIYPEKEKVNKLDEKLKSIQKEPAQAFAFGGLVRHYMPTHAESIAKIGSNAAATLNSMRPRVPKLSPLDDDLEPSMASKAKFHRTLSIAEQPLMLFHHVKTGMVTPDDVSVVKNLYPNLLPHMQKEMIEAMTDYLAGGNKISHGMRRSIGTVLEQPMDGTQYPQNMQAVIQSAMPAQQPQGKKKSGTEAAIKQANKVTALYQTPLERSEEAKRA